MRRKLGISVLAALTALVSLPSAGSAAPAQTETLPPRPNCFHGIDAGYDIQSKIEYFKQHLQDIAEFEAFCEEFTSFFEAAATDPKVEAWEIDAWYGRLTRRGQYLDAIQLSGSIVFLHAVYEASYFVRKQRDIAIRAISKNTSRVLEVADRIDDRLAKMYKGIALAGQGWLAAMSGNFTRAALPFSESEEFVGLIDNEEGWLYDSSILRIQYAVKKYRAPTSNNRNDLRERLTALYVKLKWYRTAAALIANDLAYLSNPYDAKRQANAVNLKLAETKAQEAIDIACSSGDDELCSGITDHVNNTLRQLRNLQAGPEQR